MSVNELSHLQPKLEPDGALGWRDIPLDGLNCYLRSIEAVLHSRGFSHDDVLFELGGPVTDQVPADGSPWFALRNSRARWVLTSQEEDLWPAIEAQLRNREPALVWPDYFYWPGSRFHGRRHVYDHAVLLTQLNDDRLTYLDIDADRRNGYVDSIAVDDQTRRAFKRLLVLRPGEPGRPPTPLEVRDMVTSSVPPLVRWAQGMSRLVQQWWVDPSPRLAHAVEWWIFSDLQPQLFLFTCICEKYGEEDLALAGHAATRQAKKAGLFLIALNEYRSAAPYGLGEGDLATLGDRLRDMAYVALASAEGDVRPGADRRGERLWQRLDGLSRWHVGYGIDRVEPAASSGR